MTAPDQKDAVAALLERRVRPLRKAELKRLALLLNDWRRQEANMASHELAVVPGSMRAKRIKDADALEAALAFMLDCRYLGKRPNVRTKLAPAAGKDCDGSH